MTFPIRTAREYPTIGSHLAPVATFCLGIVLLFLLAAPFLEAARYRACASRRACIRSRSLLVGWVEDEVVVRVPRNLCDDPVALGSRRFRVFREYGDE